ncbi:DUF4865 family protein [Paraburkholderia sp. BR10937]|uniref:DUF4865 family protein n=1 Tax=Paraburkholderia sp. BR10937 TaxID=3236994 RepID=UPI0034D26238
MLSAFYMHRLPADYDTGTLHTRARQLGALWDTARDLYYKAFLLRESGRYGATENNYASLYLWRHDAAFNEFIANGSYLNVTKSFGRASIYVEGALDARRGPSSTARFAYRETLAIPDDADLDATLAREADQNRDTATQQGVFASVVSLDTQRWTLTRVLLSEEEPRGKQAGTAWKILHLAQPLAHTLDTGVAA